VHLVGQVQRLLGGHTWDAYEAGIRTLVADLVGEAAAPAVLGEIVTRSGTPIAGLRQFGLSHLFPAPAVLAVTDFCGTGMDGVGAQAIRDYSRRSNR
jgi:3-methyladenine DNA glycosylase/8-oxoguanine DNA glycosylase